MTEAQPARPAPQLFQHNALALIAVFAILGGVVLVAIGIATGNGNLLSGPDITELATKLTLISLGTTLIGGGFFATLAALVLGGVRDLIFWQAGVEATEPPKTAGSYFE